MLISAIRKLARANPSARDGGAKRWRGVCGQLPPNFYVEDAFGMIVATDGAFMSTSLAEKTPIHYMSANSSNVLWELETSGEDESGFHCGADVSMISQFAGEQEELYPPLTMLRVKRREIVPAKEATNSTRGLTRGTSELKLASNKVIAMNKWMDLSTVNTRPTTKLARETTEAHEWMEKATSTVEEFVRKWHAEMMVSEGKAYIRIVVEPSFV